MKKATVSLSIFLILFLFPLPIRALNVNRNLNYGEFYGMYREAEAGWRIEGSFTTINAVEFFICDAGNYRHWINNDAAVFYEHQEQTTAHSFNLTIQYDAVWYVVFSNSYAASNNSLDAQIRFIDELGVEQTQVDVIIQNLISTPIVIGFIAAGIGISILGIWCARRKEPRPAVRYDEILSKPK